MLILTDSCFLHIPKTGGSWIKKAIKMSGIRFEEHLINGDSHGALVHCPVLEKFKFAFVRNPIDLYRSYWQYKMGAGWDIKNEIDRVCCSDNFNTFIDNIIARYPGICSQVFELFVGPEDAEIEYVGKYENLVDDLIIALTQAGEHFDEYAIKNCPPQNVSDKTRFPASYTDEQKERIKKTEAKAFERFGYKV